MFFIMLNLGEMFFMDCSKFLAILRDLNLCVTKTNKLLILHVRI